MSRRNEFNGSRLRLSSRTPVLTCACFLLLSGLLTSAWGGTSISPSVREKPNSVNPKTGDDKEPRPLDPLTPVERLLSGGESHPYTVALDEGQYFHAVVNQQGIDVVVLIAGPDGQTLTQVDRPNGLLGPEAVSLIAKMSGVYRLEVSSLNRVAAQGQYRIKMEPLRTATSLDESRIFAERAVSEGEQLRALGTADSFRQAIEKFEQALTRWRALHEPYEEAVALYGIGWSYGSIGEYQKAVSYYDSALPLMKGLNDSYGEAFVLTGLAWGYIYLGETERGYENFSRAFQLHRSLGNARGQAVTLYGMGWVHALRGENQEALNDFSQALVLRRNARDRRGEALTLASIGNIYYRLGDSRQALDGLNRALHLLQELGEQYAEADVLSNIGWVYVSTNENTPALDYLNRALLLRRRTGDRPGEATTLYGLARAEQQSGNFAQAQGRIGEAIRIIESLRTKVASQQLRTSYFASVQEYYEFYIDLLMRMQRESPTGDYAAQALQISEQARNRNLLDLLTEANVDIRQGIEPSLLEQERALQQELNAAADRQRQLLSRKHSSEQAAAAASDVASVTAQYQQIETHIHENSPRYAALTQPTPLSATEIQRQVLDEKTLLLEYALGEKRSFLWAVTPDELNSYELPKRSEIESAVRRVYDLLTERNRQVEGETSEQRRVRVAQADSKYSEEAAALSRMLLGPVSKKLADKRLLVVAQGALQFIPFGVLPSPTTLNENGNGGSPLIADHEIVSVPSASTLALLRREVSGRKPASKSVAILADPVFNLDDERLDAMAYRRKRAQVRLETSSESNRPKADKETGGSLSEHLPRLFISRWEAGEISSLVPAGESLRALDFAASRATALSPELAQYRIIHFATHAIIDNVHPELSGIALSRVNESGQPQNGFLRAHEIFNLKLSAELIVLSACRTGLGKDVEGEGLIGMTRGFMYAGVPRVVVSLWAVNDRATSELMVRFYRKMLGPERLSPAAALRAAQIEMSGDKRWPSPYFWGAFTLQGEWR